MTELAFKNAPPTASGRTADLSAVLFREFALLTRNRVNLVLGLTPMLVYLLLVNTSLSNLVGTIDYKGTQLAYSLFLLPMVLTMSVVSASGTTGIALFQEEMSGVSTQLWSWPLRRSMFLLGKLFAGMLLVLAQSVLALLIGTLLFHYPIDAGRWVALLIALALASVAFNGLYMAAAITIRDHQTFMVVTNVSVLVLVFSAPSLSTAQQLPTVLRWLSWINPVTYAVNGMRDAAIFGLGTALPSLLVLLGIALIGNGIAGRALLRRTQNL